MSEKSAVEIRTLASGQVTYLIRVVPGATLDELKGAVDVAQQALMYATSEEDEDDE
jgi:hypothetical protein